MDKSRRKFLQQSSLLTLAGIGLQLFDGHKAIARSVDKFFEIPLTLPGLPYEYSALEPHIDKITMEIHHTKHHKAYVDNLKKAMEADKISASLEDMITNVSKYSPAVRNNAGGHWNHSFFWKLMKPGGGGVPMGAVAAKIDEVFGNFDALKTQIEDAGLKRFGSGWSWLVLNADKKLVVGSTPNQDNPLMDLSELKGIPLLGVDVWEHAYYLKYQNRRGDYLKAWWNVVNWDEVNRNFEIAMK